MFAYRPASIATFYPNFYHAWYNVALYGRPVVLGWALPGAVVFRSAFPRYRYVRYW